MKVHELITLLQTFDQELPVTGLNGQEETGFVSTEGVRVMASADWDDTANPLLGHEEFWPIRLDSGEYFNGLYVDIMGF